jgi:hypothetical protein
MLHSVATFSSFEHLFSCLIIDASAGLVLGETGTFTSCLQKVLPHFLHVLLCFRPRASTYINSAAYGHVVPRSQERGSIIHEWQSRTFAAMRPAAKGQLNLWADG